MTVPNLSDELFDAAYALHEQWGPTLSIPRRDWLAQHYPALSQAELETVLQACQAVNRTVGQLAEQGAETKLGQGAVIRQLQAAHPFLRDDGLRKALFLVNYYAWHDGHDR